MPSKPDLKILHVFDHSLPLHSGYVFRSLNILREQRARGWQTFQLTTPRQNTGEDDQEAIDGWEFFRTAAPTGLLSSLPFGREISQMKATERRLCELIPQIKPDIIHAHSPVLCALPALKAAKKFNIPVVYEIRAFWEDAAVDHGTTREGSLRYRLTRKVETHVVRNADAVTTICDGLYQDLLKRKIPGHKLTIIPNAVDIEQFPPSAVKSAELAQEKGIDGKTVIGFIGSFYAYEGLDLLLDAAGAILKKDPNTVFLLVGGGPCEEALKKQVDRLNLRDHVIFTGRVPHSEVPKYYSLIDLLVFPRHPMRLTEIVTPLKPLEAMAQQKVLVASDVGGHKELIKDQETGYLFTAGSAKALSDRVLSTLSNRQEWPKIGKAGRKYVEEERNWAQSVANYDPVYRQLLEKRSQAD